MSVLKPAMAVIPGGELSGKEMGSPFLTGLRLPLKDAPGSVPTPGEMGHWMSEAEGALEWVLADFDSELLKAVRPSLAAQKAIQRFMGWIRSSAAEFLGGPMLESQTVLSFMVEAKQWDGLARECVQACDDDPGAVDRFLGLYLSMAHELATKGHARLLLEP